MISENSSRAPGDLLTNLLSFPDGFDEALGCGRAHLLVMWRPLSMFRGLRILLGRECFSPVVHRPVLSLRDAAMRQAGAFKGEEL
jgi:hypothetical protein